MQIRHVRVLRGPNIWARFPVIEATVDLRELPTSPSHKLPQFNERLVKSLPSLRERRGPGDQGNLWQQLQAGLSLSEVLGYVALELQEFAWKPVAFCTSRETPDAGLFRVVFQYQDEELARRSLATARELCLAALHGQPFDTAASLEALRTAAGEVCLNPGAWAIAESARARNIPVRRLNEGNLLQLGHASRQRRISSAETDQTSATAKIVAQDRELTRAMLRAVGISVPDGRTVTDPDDAWSAAEEIGLPVAVRPRYHSAATLPTVPLKSREEVVAAYDALRVQGAVVVEKFISGHRYHLLVIGDKVVATAPSEASPAESNGSGGHTALGGDLTSHIQPEIVAQALEAARVVGLDVAGIDIVAEDIIHPQSTPGGAIVAVHANPDLSRHLGPASPPHSVGDSLVEHLFPHGQTGRIPVVSITGVNGKTTTTRLTAHILSGVRHRVGMTCTDGIYIGSKRIVAFDCSGPKSARDVLANPAVDAAVLEVARGGILREGLGFDRCDVAIVTNIGSGDHLGMAWIDTPEQLAIVKRAIVEAVAPDGAAVLNATDPLVVQMAPHCAGSVIFFAQDPAHPVMQAHRAQGGRVVFVRDQALIAAEGDHEILLALLAHVPLTLQGRIGFQVENVLAASAAAWALKVPQEAIRAALESFRGDLHDLPGRFNILASGESTVIADYGHNPSAVQALIEAVGQFPHKSRMVIYSAEGDRRDEAIMKQAELIANAFDRVILYEEPSRRRGRAPGVIFDLLRRGVACGTRVSEVIEIHGELAAIEMGLRSVRPGELLLIQVDAVEVDIAFVQQHLTPAAR
jgi:cyanophycin synthetase